MNECDACKFEYVKDNSLVAVQAFHRHPYPLVGTCRHDSVPNVQKSYKHQRSLKLGYKRVGIRQRLPCR